MCEGTVYTSCSLVDETYLSLRQNNRFAWDIYFHELEFTTHCIFQFSTFIGHSENKQKKQKLSGIIYQVQVLIQVRKRKFLRGRVSF